MADKLEHLTRNSNRFKEFCNRLEGPEGCNFKEDEEGKMTWTCAGGQDQSLSRKILNEMGGIDVDATLAYFTAHGGHCDCEVLWNVAT